MAAKHGIRRKIERSFEGLGFWISEHPWKVLLACLALTGALGSQLPWLNFDTSIDGFLKPTDPLRVNYDHFREDFGRDEMILVALRPKNVFDIEFLKLLKTIHRDLEDHLPRLDEVTSLVNARNTYGRGDVLVVDDLLLKIPETPEELELFREHAMSDPVYRDIWISDDGTIANLAIESDAFDMGNSIGAKVSSKNRAQMEFDFDEDPTALENAIPETREHKPLRSEHNAEIVAAVEKLVSKYRSDDLEIRVGGSPSMTARLLLAMESNLQTFMLASLGVIALLLAFVFRRASAVFLPLLVVSLALVSMLGSMAIGGIDVAFGTQILPSAILAIGIGYTVHLLTIFYRKFDETKDKKHAVVHALGHSGLAILMSAVTTMVGFGSFVVSDLLPLYRMGLVAPFGVGFVYLYAVLLLPALLVLLPIRARTPARATGQGPKALDRLLTRIGDFSHRNAKPVAVLGIGLGVAALIGASRLHFSHDPMHWLPKDDRVRVNHDYLEKKLDGTMVLEMVLDFDKENALHDPEVLHKIETLTDYAKSRPTGDVVVGKTLSIVDVSKEIHQALYSGNPEYYRIPPDQWTAGQEFLLFENSGSDDLEKVTNSLFSKARITMKVEWLDSRFYPIFIKKLEAFAHDLFGPDVELYTTGMLALMSRTMSNVMDSAARAYVLAFLLITPLMILLIGNLRAGLVSMLPNLFPIVATLAAMAIFDIELDMFTILVGSIALGLAVDDTIHMVHGYARNLSHTGDVGLALHQTMETSGRALMFTSLVLCAGFSVFLLSELNNLILFGGLTTMAIGFALIADIVLTPALLSLATRGQAAKIAAIGAESDTSDAEAADQISPASAA